MNKLRRSGMAVVEEEDVAPLGLGVV